MELGMVTWFYSLHWQAEAGRSLSQKPKPKTTPATPKPKQILIGGMMGIKRHKWLKMFQNADKHNEEPE